MNFLPLVICSDGDFMSAHSEARRRLAPYQQVGVLNFLIERQGEIYGAVRNMEFASKRQEILWNELCETYKGKAK